jgi:hypothetical protein
MILVQMVREFLLRKVILGVLLLLAPLVFILLKMQFVILDLV